MSDYVHTKAVMYPLDACKDYIRLKFNVEDARDISEVKELKSFFCFRKN